jgi:hypothetical protein
LFFTDFRAFAGRSGLIKILGASPEVFEIRNPRFEIYQRSKLRGIHHPERNKGFRLFSLRHYIGKIVPEKEKIIGCPRRRLATALPFN